MRIPMVVTPYPQPGPPPPRPPVQGDRSIVLLVVLMGLGGLLFFASLVGWGVYRGYAKTRAAAADPATATSAHGREKVALPPAQRRVPHHAVSILQGCREDDLRELMGGIDGAIEVGAPLYNGGNFAGCYHLYEGAAADIERKIGKSCPGAASALSAGRTRAASMATPSDQAWAMRDAFDGLIEVVERRSGAGQ
jgi:serine protease Do